MSTLHIARTALAVGASLALWTQSSFAAPCAATFGATYAGSYTCNDLGTPGTVTGLLGGLTFLNNNTLLIGENANASNGVINQIGVTRDGSGHITGFSGPATLYSTAPFIDGGLSFGPGGVLFFTGFPNNTMGEIKPGSASPDKTINLSSISPSVQSSVGSLGFVPPGFSGAGDFKILSYNGGEWYDATLTADGSGTYDVAVAFVNTPGGGPEGIAYVLSTNPGFSGNSVLLDQYGLGKVEAYSVDANGDPVLGSAQDFLTGLTGAEGAVIDPVTGDFLFSTFGSGNHVDVVSGFQAPVTPPSGVPEPATLLLMGASLVALCVTRRRGVIPRLAHARGPMG